MHNLHSSIYCPPSHRGFGFSIIENIIMFREHCRCPTWKDKQYKLGPRLYLKKIFFQLSSFQFSTFFAAFLFFYPVRHSSCVISSISIVFISFPTALSSSRSSPCTRILAFNCDSSFGDLWRYVTNV